MAQNLVLQIGSDKVTVRLFKQMFAIVLKGTGSITTGMVLSYDERRFPWSIELDPAKVKIEITPSSVITKWGTRHTYRGEWSRVSGETGELYMKSGKVWVRVHGHLSPASENMIWWAVNGHVIHNLGSGSRPAPYDWAAEQADEVRIMWDGNGPKGESVYFLVNGEEILHIFAAEDHTVPVGSQVCNVRDVVALLGKHGFDVSAYTEFDRVYAPSLVTGFKKQ